MKSKRMSVGKCFTAWGLRSTRGVGCASGSLSGGGRRAIPYRTECRQGFDAPGAQSPEEALSILQTLMPLSNASPCSALIFKMNTEANQVNLSQLLEAICNAT